MATDFEGYTHEQLLAMIASLDSETVVARATQLSGAAVVIKDIGESLRKHQVKGWEGEAADAFQTWVTGAGNATLRLADYSEEGSKWLTHAAQTMVEVKANTPKYDTSAAANLASAHEFHNDPDAQQMGRTAHAKLTGDRHEAIQQLTKLAQSYDTSATQMNKAEIPTFPPPPKRFEPTGYNDLEHVSRSGSVDSGSGTGGGSYLQSSSKGGGSVHGTAGVLDRPSLGSTLQPTAGPMPTPVLPDRGADVGLDHVAILPDKTLTPVTGLPGGGGPALPGGGGPSSVPPMPPLTLPPTRGVPGPVGGPLPSVRPPGGGVSSRVGLPPRDTGIVGGKPIASGPSAAGIPRGTVIGGEGAHPGGRGMGSPMGGGVGGGPPSPRGGFPVGRRLAMEPGGVVGGRQAVGGGQSFTQGGSGLVRNGSGPGTAGSGMGHGGAGASTPGGRRRGQGSGRPGYLAEDEETWQGDRRVVPPVID
ncbi:WXG100 family type VII secretion target [Streptomyces sp. NBC_01276]|uniref:WXG100 family type VII secretion target n=1 Tax=Streptomyces sp. NBC_01276 TaxID=2903808 RepID=UPI00352C0DF0